MNKSATQAHKAAAQQIGNVRATNAAGKKLPKTPAAQPVKAAELSFVITSAARPSAGSALASYTAAWLELSGMIAGHMVPAATVRAIAGDTAFAYHTKAGRFTRTAEGVKLSDEGVLHFLSRTKITPDPEMTKAYLATMSTGETSAMVKNPEFIKPINKGAK
jgi:hypothetical protein